MGDLVYTNDFSTTPVTWIPGKVAKLTGPLSYHVTLLHGRVVRRHATTPTCAVLAAAPVQPAPVRRSNHCRPPPDRLGW